MTLEKFIEAIKDDIILFDICIGVYRSGKLKGKTHDHGSGFRVNRRDLPKIFNIEEITSEKSAINFQGTRLKRKIQRKPQIEITKYLKTNDK